MALAELERLGFPDDMVRAVASHADYLEVSRETPMEKALFAVDELSGFVMACAYVRPQGIEGMTPKSVKKKMKTPAFAAAVNRDDMREGAELLGVDFDEHLAFVIAALQPHADALGLSGSGAAA
jgi:predicted hydrolase (HD superfamily)